ncbi:MAG: hypothetical protein H6822_20635 [Planctomycetaceae bacterium]|nr:hypothetical protein [Planctomycetales bacterium]MCB9924598.1 hypothetical protein [Planctomycetaceae bacterium]
MTEIRSSDRRSDHPYVRRTILVGDSFSRVMQLLSSETVPSWNLVW